MLHGRSDSWVTAVTVSMHDAEVRVLPSAQATHRETLPLLEKQLMKTLLLTAPTFPYQDGAADPGLGQI